MQLKYSITKTDDNQSFYAARKTIPYYGLDWHYHQEIELLYPIIGTGVRIVGDSMEYFNENELVLLGSQLPHLFKNELDDSDSKVDYIIIKFKPSLIYQFLDSIPEFSHIVNMLNNAHRGILFPKVESYTMLDNLIRVCESKGAMRIISLLNLLDRLAKIQHTSYLASKSYRQIVQTSFKDDRLQRVINFIAKNYTEEITLKELSDISFMTTNSFCRYFKERTGKTAFQFIREYRISRACQMLISSNKSISQIYQYTGFNSFSSFNRVFKSIKGISASDYKYKYQEIVRVS